MLKKNLNIFLITVFYLLNLASLTLPCQIQASKRNLVQECSSVDALENLIAEEDFLVVDFFANWCSPCKYFSPVFKKTAKIFKDVKFIKINVSNFDFSQYGIESIPTVLIFKNGEMLSKKEGALPLDALKTWIEEHK